MTQTLAYTITSGPLLLMLVSAAMLAIRLFSNQARAKHARKIDIAVLSCIVAAIVITPIGQKFFTSFGS